MDLKKRIKELEPELISLRRYFHRHPERSWEEYNTQKKIMEYLTKEGIPCTAACRSGVIATIKGSHSSDHTIGIRADIDALPVTEETGCEFSSENPGVMHACGHDVHIAILLMTAKLLNERKEDLTVTVRCIFQPAEEYIQDSGSTYMKDEPLVLECERTIGLHVWSTIPAGCASLADGPVMASADTFDIHITGKGGHGGHPELTIDPIAAGVSLCIELQRMKAREIAGLVPAVLSVTSFQAGSTSNVIPEEAHLSGTARAFSEEMRGRFPEMLQRASEGISISTGAHIIVDYHWGPPVTANDSVAVATGKRAAKTVFGSSNLIQFPPQMSGEDFSKYTSPKAFLLLGGGSEDPAYRYPQHSSKYFVDESVLKLGVEYFLRYVMEWEKEFPLQM